jgi:hypothetical protein
MLLIQSYRRRFVSTMKVPLDRDLFKEAGRLKEHLEESSPASSAPALPSTPYTGSPTSENYPSPTLGE